MLCNFDHLPMPIAKIMTFAINVIFMKLTMCWLESLYSCVEIAIFGNQLLFRFDRLLLVKFSKLRSVQINAPTYHWSANIANCPKNGFSEMLANYGFNLLMSQERFDHTSIKFKNFNKNSKVKRMQANRSNNTFLFLLKNWSQLKMFEIVPLPTFQKSFPWITLMTVFATS